MNFKNVMSFFFAVKVCQISEEKNIFFMLLRSECSKNTCYKFELVGLKGRNQKRKTDSSKNS